MNEERSKEVVRHLRLAQFVWKPGAPMHEAIREAADELERLREALPVDGDSCDRKPLRIRQGWSEAGKRGVRLGPDVYVGGQLWTPVLWDGEDDPTFHKTAGIEAREVV